MNFKEYFLANEFQLKGVLRPKDCPIVPSSIPKTGFRNSGASKMSMIQPAHPYKPKPLASLFRKPG
jgi:hypothetical protein